MAPHMPFYFSDLSALGLRSWHTPSPDSRNALLSPFRDTSSESWLGVTPFCISPENPLPEGLQRHASLSCVTLPRPSGPPRRGEMNTGNEVSRRASAVPREPLRMEAYPGGQ